MEAEAVAPATADNVGAVRRLVDEPAYGAAAWAVVYGNDKYVGTMPSEGAVPATACVRPSCGPPGPCKASRGSPTQARARRRPLCRGVARPVACA
eukprot:2241714-Pleurochrysis_carterae.AAC.1